MKNALADAHRRLLVLDLTKTEFLSLISHELRTPLNGLLGLSELLFEDKPQDPESATLRELFTQSGQRLLSLVDDALLFTEISLSGDRFDRSVVGLNRLIAEVVDTASPLSESRGVTLQRVAGADTSVVGDVKLLQRAMQELIETAVLLADEGSRVRIESTPMIGCSEMTVDVGCAPLPAEVLRRFFDVFRVNETETGGHLGLGPALASRILALFGHKVTIARQEPAGLRFTLQFEPAAAPHGQ